MLVPWISARNGQNIGLVFLRVVNMSILIHYTQRPLTFFRTKSPSRRLSDIHPLPAQGLIEKRSGATSLQERPAPVFQHRVRKGRFYLTCRAYTPLYTSTQLIMRSPQLCPKEIRVILSNSLFLVHKRTTHTLRQNLKKNSFLLQL